MRLWSKKENKCVNEFDFFGSVLFLDTETTGIDWWKNDVFLISWTDQYDNSYALDLRDYDDETERILERLRILCIDNKIRKVGHNIKFDAHFLRKLNFKIRNISDTLILSRLYNEEMKSYALKDLAVTLLKKEVKEKITLDTHLKIINHMGVITTEQMGLFGDGKVVENGKVDFRKNYDKVPYKIIVDYAIADVLLTRNLFEFLIKNMDKDLAPVIELEEALLQHIIDIEARGFLVDVEFLRSQKEITEKKLDILKREILMETGDFDILSNVALADILFNKLGFSPTLYTDTGKPKVDKYVLEKLGRHNSLVNKIQEFRSLHQYLSTFLDGLLERQDNGVIHADYKTVNTRSGRMSCANPNLQNIPKRDEIKSEIRAAFVAREGFLLYSFDYSQIEYRLYAHYLCNPILIQAFRDGKDIHAETARMAFGVQGDVSDKDRRHGKDLNFGLIYGMGATSLADKLQCTEAEARNFIEKYFLKIPEAQKFKNRVYKVLRERGYVKTILGRKRRLSPDEYYKGVNAIIQGSAADIFKQAVIEVSKFLADKRAHIVNMVHDELVIEIPDDEMYVVREIKKIMEQVITLRVPIVVDVEVGKNWFETKSITGMEVKL